MKPYAHVALLRGINVTGHNKIPMADLRRIAGGLGWERVQTYIQSGNLIFEARAKPADLEAALEEAIRRRFGLSIPVIVRSADDWRDYVRTNPFPAATDAAPNAVLLALSKTRPLASAAEELRKRASAGEQVARVGDALWIHYAGGIGRSKLSPAVLDRLAGSPVTARNWRTVLKLDEMMRASPS